MAVVVAAGANMGTVGLAASAGMANRARMGRLASSRLKKNPLAHHPSLQLMRACPSMRVMTRDAAVTAGVMVRAVPMADMVRTGAVSVGVTGRCALCR
jgi:hypothetical protein